jgi:hypothetical protein
MPSGASDAFSDLNKKYGSGGTRNAGCQVRVTLILFGLIGNFVEIGFDAGSILVAVGRALGSDAADSVIAMAAIQFFCKCNLALYCLVSVTSPRLATAILVMLLIGDIVSCA